ncbi:MAG TPA: hypothetical protein PKE26_15290 [Kiritimatiellia bacterium]|nr:hypothetical protein [Kiritimatiellia bacterium]HMP00460.1 hypothetical protein [Kiritimatiellia bacterium]
MTTETENITPPEVEAPKAPPSDGPLPERVNTTQPKSKRASLGSVRRPLTEDELKSSAVQKILIDILEDAESGRDEYKAYVDAFHGADKRAAILAEKLNLDHSVEITFGVGIALGGVIMGLAPYLWGVDKLAGLISAMIGLCLIIGASVARAIKR